MPESAQSGPNSYRDIGTSIWTENTSTLMRRKLFSVGGGGGGGKSVSISVCTESIKHQQEFHIEFE